MSRPRSGALAVTAQRRPGPAPRRHSSRTRSSRSPATPLNEGRDPRPGDTSLAAPNVLHEQDRSTKAGTRAPATLPSGARLKSGIRTLNEGRDPRPGDTSGSRMAQTWQTALNEGRDPRPGDTWMASTVRGSIGIAQRRPGPAPRRHLGCEFDLHAADARSTKAGTRAPATPVGRIATTSPARGRSTKAGTRAPATHPLRRQTLPLEARSTKAGTRAPATHSTRAARSRRCRSLNEGRDPRPGDTWRPSVRSARRPSLNEGRDPRPGDTRQRLPAFAAELLRSTKAGTRAPATHPLRRQTLPLEARSTKAGTRAPATPGPRDRSATATPAPLNEGRDPRPGDTS